MFNWSAWTLFLYIQMRMLGLILLSPIFARSGIPGMYRTGLALTLSITAYSAAGALPPVPDTLLELAVRMVLEMALGLMMGLLMQFFFYIPEQAGEIVDIQMGMSMGRTYDPGSRNSVTVTANLLNMMALLLFFAVNGHLTLVRMVITSGELIPFGAVSLGEEAASYALELFAECVLLAIKLSLPILGAEILGQVGMGILMKAIPQINIFAINIELKVIVGMLMLLMLLSPIASFLLDAEMTMLQSLRGLLSLSAG